MLCGRRLTLRHVDLYAFFRRLMSDLRILRIEDQVTNENEGDAIDCRR